MPPVQQQAAQTVSGPHPVMMGAHALAGLVQAGQPVAGLHVGQHGGQHLQPALRLCGRQLTLALDLVDGALRDGRALEGAVVAQLQRQRVVTKVGRLELRARPQAGVVNVQPQKAHLPLAQQGCGGQRLPHKAGRGGCVIGRSGGAGDRGPQGHRQHAHARQAFYG